MDHIFLTAEQLTPENLAICDLGEKKSQAGAAYTFIKNGRSLSAFCQWLRADRDFDRAVNTAGKPRWSDAY
jgi:hypothetical protein